jgi:hypothetical protein
VSDNEIMFAILRDIRARLEKMPTTEQMNGRFEGIDGRLDQLEAKGEVLNGRFDVVQRQLVESAAQQLFISRSITNIAKRIDPKITDHETRISQLEDERDKAKG